MLRNKKGISFIAVVGSCTFMIILATIAIQLAANNNLLVSKYTANKTSYSSTSDALNQAAKYLVDNSSGEKLDPSNIIALANTKLDLDMVFGIDELTTSDITIVATTGADGESMNGKQVTLRKNNYLINVFLSDDGSLSSLSNIFFDNEKSIDFAYKTGFLTTSYMYENGLFYSTTSNGPLRNNLDSNDNNKVNQAIENNDNIYNDLLPANPDDVLDNYKDFFTDDKTEYRESYVDNKLIDAAIKKALPANGKFTNTWNKTTTYSGTTYIKGDVDLSKAKANEFILNDNAVVYISGDLIMDYLKEQDDVYLNTFLTLKKNALLVVKGNIIISNDVMTPEVICGSGSNIIAGKDITIKGTQDPDKTIGDDYYIKWKNGKLAWWEELIIGIFKKNYFENLAESIKGKLEGTFISGNDFKVIVKDKEGGTVPELPVRATVYADNNADFEEAIVKYNGVSFMFASKMLFVSNDSTLDILSDEFFGGQVGTEFLFVIIDDGVEYGGKTSSLKANIFTTNITNQDTVLTQIEDVYSAGSESGSGVINSIFKWLKVDSDVNVIKEDEIDVEIGDLGLAKVLTEGSTDKSYASALKQQ